MCAGLPKVVPPIGGQKRAGKNYFFLAPIFNQRANIFYPFFQIFILFVNFRFGLLHLAVTDGGVFSSHLTVA